MHIYLRTPLEINVGETDKDHGASQPMTESQHAAVINDGHDHIHNSNVSSPLIDPIIVRSTTLTEAELLKEIERLKSENQTIKDSQPQPVWRSLKILRKMRLNSLDLRKRNQTKDAELTAKDAELKILQDKLKVIEDKEGKATENG